MKKVKIDGRICIGPTQSQPEIQILANRLRQSADELKHLSGLLKVTGTETALKILYLLSIEKELCVCDIADVLDMKVSTISHQLKKLSTHKIVISERRGKTIFYSLKKNKFTETLRNLFSIIDQVYADASTFSIFVTK